MSIGIEVHRYCIERVYEILTRHRKSDAGGIIRKPILSYFDTYFSDLEAKTIVLENPYMDRDFLDDFSSYYVRCYGDYPRNCSRLHFFSTDFGEREFRQLLTRTRKRNLKSIQSHYLGFVVTKGLPSTVIGRTCLTTYPEDNDRRQFPIVRRYEANLLGIPLQVKTLAFQEQDRTVARCATSALWTIFHGTGMLFQHRIPSPVEITRAATDRFPSERSFPNDGLDLLQAVDAIRSVGLEPTKLDISDPYVFKSTVYAYLKGRIPALLGICWGLPEENEECHAVAVTGFSLGRQDAQPLGDYNFRLRASHIDEIYAHDDGIGPFARMKFVDNDRKLQRSWADHQGETQTEDTNPEFLLVPLYHKIRIPFYKILRITVKFDGELKAAAEGTIPDEFEWDIFLTTVNDLKTDLFLSPHFLSPVFRRQILLRALPRFIWRCTALLGGEPILDLLFDATDIEQGELFVGAVTYDESNAETLRFFSTAVLGRDATLDRTVQSIFKCLAQRD